MIDRYKELSEKLKSVRLYLFHSLCVSVCLSVFFSLSVSLSLSFSITKKCMCMLVEWLEDTWNYLSQEHLNLYFRFCLFHSLCVCLSFCLSLTVCVSVSFFLFYEEVEMSAFRALAFCLSVSVSFINHTNYRLIFNFII